MHVNNALEKRLRLGVTVHVQQARGHLDLRNEFESQRRKRSERGIRRFVWIIASLRGRTCMSSSSWCSAPSVCSSAPYLLAPLNSNGKVVWILGLGHAHALPHRERFLEYAALAEEAVED